MFEKILNGLGIQTAAQKRAAARIERTNDFIDNLLLPDMAVRGFGFGRVAVAEALRRRGFATFGQLDSIDGSFFAELEGERGVGKKVVRAFADYMEKRTGVRLYFDAAITPLKTPAVDAMLRSNALLTAPDEQSAP